MPAEEFEKLRLEVLPLVVLFLPGNIGFDVGHNGLAHGEPSITLLPGKAPKL
jgi:hypothetical protein